MLDAENKDQTSSTGPTTTTERRSLSEKIWGFSWRDHLPINLGTRGITLELSTFDEVYAFAREHFDRVFDLDKKDNNPFLHWESGPSKEKFYRETMDIFVVKKEGRIIGINVCGPSDWSSYYLRHSSVLPEAQGNLAFNGFVNFVIEKMRAVGVKRIQAETSPANFPILQTLSRLRFNLTGMQITERWGAIMLMTKFLDAKNESVFLEQFCFGNHWQADKSH